MSVVSTSTPSEDIENSNNPKRASLSLKRDQQVEAMSLTVPLNPLQQISEYTDPAILAARPSVFRYAPEKLLELRQVPLSQKRPDYLDGSYNNGNGVWDPELWHRSRFNGGSENGEVVYKRRTGDPRERIRKEDGIVLSPQRRSFNSGCFVPLKENQRSNRPHSPIIGVKPDSNIGQFRDIPPGSRRIGSGRILSRDVPWDYQEKESDEFPYRKERRDTDREDSRFERRSYGREFDFGKDKEKHGGRNGRFIDRRRIENHEEEPEWYSGGPVSQHETIELRGFDDVDSERVTKNKKQIVSKKRKERKNSEQNENKQPLVDTGEQNKDHNTVVDHDNNNTVVENLKITNEDKCNTTDHNMFNLDDFLKCDTIAGILTNGVDSGGGDAGSSRFSQFFTRESPAKQMDSRRSSFQDDHIIRNVLNDITEPNVTIPSDSDLYFAPISPAANTGTLIGGLNSNHPLQKPLNIMEMLQRGKQSNREVPSSRVVSLEELEARFLQPGRTEQTPNNHSSVKTENDTTAFQRLVAQMKGGHGITNGPTISKMLFETLHDDPPCNSQGMGSASPNMQHNDLAFKLQQVQNQVQAQQRQQAQIDMMSKLMNAGLHRQQLGTSPLPDLGMNQSRELLNRPEAQAILQGLKRGDITPQHLQQQLAANPAMQPRHRELLFTILKLHGGGSGIGFSPRILSPVAPHSVFQQQQQQHQLRISPLPNAYCVSPILATSPNTLTVPAIHQRIPSPRELQQHTQAIMQNALIKKKLEEQQENFKRRQEQQHLARGASPAKHTPSPTPLAFTPTSVLRKMTADKDDGCNKTPPQGRPVTGMKPSLLQSQTWNLQQQLKQPAGRPIVKANASLQAQQPLQSQHDLQQFYQQQRLYGQQQQQSRKVGSQQFPSQSGASSSSHQSLHNYMYQQQFSSNPQQFQQQHLTQHQLRAQHQQHQPPQQTAQPSQYSNKPSVQQQQQHWSQQHHPMLSGHNYDNRSFNLMGDRGGASNNGGELSPIANQLARWFPPELLEQARAGKVPSMPNSTLAQHAVNLEQSTAPPIHN